MDAYLDNAATSWPKPESVYRAVSRFMRLVGATPGRSGHRREEEAARICDSARGSLAQLFNAPSPDGVIFTLNATQAINMALKGILKPGDHVITSSIEHNAMWRPLKALERNGVAMTAVPCAADGTLAPADVEAAIRPATRMIALQHASNVLGTILPIAEIGRIAGAHDILYLVDAAQTAGAYPIDMAAMRIDLLAFAGHKGLYGPHGTGGLVVRPGVVLETWIEGGSGAKSELETMPEEELLELAQIYQERGLDKELSLEVAKQLTKHDALLAHARDELGLNDFTQARPLQAALSSGASFVFGGTLPMIVAYLGPIKGMEYVQYGFAVVFLMVLGAVAARAGRSNMLIAVIRISFWGIIAMVITALIGHLFGTQVD